MAAHAAGRSHIQPERELMPQERRLEDSVLVARLAAQGLSGRRVPNVLEATRRLLAVQAQDPRAARLAVRARSASTRAAEVDEALTDERSLVITWANRGTLHLIAAEDEPLLHALTTPQLRATSDRRLGEEGVDPAARERAMETIVKALTENGPMTRTQLRARLQSARVPVTGQALVHILFRATLEGLIVRGPMVCGDHAFVLRADWLGRRPKVDRARALAELARRYLAGHGPADDRDLAKWAQLPLRDARAAIGAIRRHLHERPDGLVDLRRKQTPELPPPRLLGPFDPLLLGWRSRAFVLGDRHDVVLSNGIIRSIALVDGRAAGTWRLRRGQVHLELWSDQPSETVASLTRDGAAVCQYLESGPCLQLRQPAGEESALGIRRG